MKKLLSMALAITIVLSVGAQAFATDALPLSTTSSYADMQNMTYAVYGKIASVTDTQITIEKYNNGGTIILNTSSNTYFLEATSGQPLEKPLKVGDHVAGYHGAAMTASLPPQSNAIAIIGNIPQDMGFPKYVVVKSVEKTDSGVKVTVDGGSAVITLPKEMPISPYLTKNIVTIDDIKVGSELILWYDIMTTSMPGFAASSKAVLLPEVRTQNVRSEIILSTQAGVVSVIGQEINLDGQASYKKGDTEMLPLRIICEALGYQVEWNAKNASIIVKKGNMTATLGEGRKEYGYNKMNVTLDCAPEIVNGRTFVPANFFNEVLTHTITISDAHV